MSEEFGFDSQQRQGIPSLSITSRHSVDPTQPSLYSRGTRGVFTQAKEPEVWNWSLTVIQGSSITNIEKHPAASPSFWLRCKHDTWMTINIRHPPCRHENLGLCTCSPLELILVTWRRRNQSQVSLARRWQLASPDFSRKSLFSQLLPKGNKEMEATGPHKANRTWNFLRRCYRELPKPSLYSPDLVHRDFHLLGRDWQAVCNRRRIAARSPPGYRQLTQICFHGGTNA